MTNTRKRRPPATENDLLGLELDEVLEEHEHTGDVVRVDPAQTGAQFEGRRHRRERSA